MRFPRKENLFINEEIANKRSMEEDLKEEVKPEAEEEVKSEKEEKVHTEWDKDAMRLKKEMLDQVIQGLKEEGDQVRQQLNKLEEAVRQELENLEEQVMHELKKQEKLQRPRINKLAEQVKLELKDLDWLVKQKKELGQEEDKLRKKIRLSLQVMKEHKERVTHYVSELEEQLILKERRMYGLKIQEEQQQQQITEKRNLKDLDLPELKELEEKVMQRLNDLDWHVKQKTEHEEETRAEKLVKMMKIPKLAKNI
ncbi:golgin subfamily A member 6-like protein 7 [Octopus bimaculoides]|uniref:Uncharacterized protein n=1 Tax=Octopus bimaculoides TaxID=37653 RepID=A0A0L8H6Q5_OCTBM|nr:golgin subfamily A member 6-like protein 7 [Octopus bimaculoides]